MREIVTDLSKAHVCSAPLVPASNLLERGDPVEEVTVSKSSN